MSHTSISKTSNQNRLSALARAARLVLLFFALFAASETGAIDIESHVVVAPASDWARPLFFPRLPANTRMDAGEEQRYLLKQFDINARDNEIFFHTVRQICNVAGVQNGSHISIDFDPNYESVRMHWVRIWRGTNFLNRLDRDKIKLIQQERDLDEYIYNGQHSAVLVLDDVRVGDIIDFAYTIQGANPVFGGKFVGSLLFQFEYPVERLVTRVLWPSTRRLFVKNHGTTIQPVVTTKKDQGLLEFVWDKTKIPALHVEDSLPVWYDPEPWVQLSEFPNWAEVNRWAMTLFNDSSAPSPELKQKVEEWRRIPNRSERILAVLRFLQDDIRYFGIEMGTSSHKPSTASTVFDRRFGDCKDKAMLFVVVLRMLGIDASPVLVNSRLHHTLDDWQPTPTAFDHVIALVRLEDRTFWFDPTRSYQRGPISAHYLSNFERGLVIRPGTTALTPIFQKTGLPLTTITEYFQLGGIEASADLKVVTVAEGRDADLLRADFATRTRDSIEKDYLNFYAAYYPKIKKAQAVQLNDDQEHNKVELTEYYTIDNMWTQSSEDRRHRCVVWPHTISALLRKPTDLHRTMPLGISFPVHQIYHAEISLPDTWPGRNESKTLSTSAFTLERHIACNGRKTYLDFDYTAQADAVAPDVMDDYLTQLGEAEKFSGYEFIWP